METLADKSAVFGPAAISHRDAGAAGAAFVRITFSGCERPENGAGIYSFKAAGK